MFSCIDTGIIRPSSSPFASLITVVRKKDRTIRLCIDFHRLNSVTIFDAEPIPTLDELLAQLTGSKVFTKIDLCKGYWQIPMDEDPKLFTAFQTPLGLMEFNFMPFDLCTAAPTLQKAMRKAVGHLPHVASYLMIFSSMARLGKTICLTWRPHGKPFDNII
ncbi:retrovirus-related pol polyprotein from transposon 17.6 [Plakobranchus ocellatus]|uniref:Retrovirus-related pol polyprotein from transposon 17.6 n=1 Tax=Plakobranchus ocellatus TaxID=259542 RepID=A0AAV4CW03_9GAST|nr:retrovirus-related pol polyprotein from transposon 17.6 [Plakobranchus ocellatus]